MTNERTEPKTRPIQSTPEKQPLPGSTSSTGDQDYRNEHYELHSNSDHCGAPLPPPLATQPYATSPHGYAERDQNTRQLSQDEEQQLFDPFIFVNEQELQTSRNSELRQAIRSHVRKSTHIKQRRLNAASRPDSTSVKKILKRPSGIESSHPALRMGSEGLPLRTQSRLSPSATVQASYLLLPPDLPFDSTRREENPEADLDTTISEPHTFSRCLGTLSRNLIVQAPPQNSFQISRHQLDSSKYKSVTLRAFLVASFSIQTLNLGSTDTPYSLLLEDGAPLLYLQARNWPFPQPLRGPSPATSVWMPSVIIPVPNAHNPRPCLLKSAGTVPWIINSLDYFLFKDETIRWVNQQLQQSSRGTSGTTMGVIVCLMTWEVSGDF
jgi:hypothetical protein